MVEDGIEWSSSSLLRVEKQRSESDTESDLRWYWVEQQPSESDTSSSCGAEFPRCHTTNLLRIRWSNILHSHNVTRSTWSNARIPCNILSHWSILCHTLQYQCNTLSPNPLAVSSRTRRWWESQEAKSVNFGKAPTLRSSGSVRFASRKKGKSVWSAAILCNTFVILLCIQRKRSALFGCECKQWCAPHWLAAVWVLSAVQTCRLTTFGGNREPEDWMQILLCEIYYRCKYCRNKR